MFCTNCGNKLNQGDNFCGKCGTAVRSEPAPKIDIPMAKIERPAPSEFTPEPAPTYRPPIRKSAELKADKKREKLRADLKVLLEKDRGREITDAELNQSEMWLRGYADLMWDLGLKEMERQKKLKENPKGFHLEGEGYTCFICGGAASKEKSWYDKYGIKCLTCQDAIDKKIIPATAANDKDSWYSANDLEYGFLINRFGLRRFIKEKLLKPRIIPGLSGGSHYQLFFIADHKDVLPPKKFTESQVVKETKDGQDWYHSEPWFNFANVKEILKGYKILDYMQTLKKHEIQDKRGTLNVQLHPGSTSILEIKHVNKVKPKNKSSQASVK
jgi:hypothetical protein